jgi:hypothetical protein
MDLVKGANLGLRFFLEMAALAALGYWGFQVGAGPLARVALGVGAPLIAAVVWGLFVAPKATMNAPEAVRLLVQAAVFGGAALALARADHATMGAVLALVAVANAALMLAWNQ